MSHNLLISRVLIFAFTLLTMSAFGQDVNIGEGKTLFRNKCATCHNKNMVDNATGPALAGVEERWADYPREDLYLWIRNSQSMIDAGHPRAVEVWNEWKPTQMNNFLELTDQDIENILAYIVDVVENPPVAITAVTDSGSGSQEGGLSNNLLFAVLFFILALLAIVLYRIITNLNYLSKVQAGDQTAERRTLVDLLTSKGVIGFALFALIVIGGYTTVNNAINLGRQQGYQPDQPIKFSHATHAGLHKVDCQYCHDGARRSKHSVIPAANTCMNCHSAIKKGSKYGTAELTKIYASIGWDPTTNQYIENYDEMSKSEIEEVFKAWITDNYVADGGSLDSKGEYEINEQWDDIVESLTNETKKKIQGPIEWVRIHNLPDHVYFNHAQHVSVGKVECQTCHGKIEEMEVVAQHSPLSMGWCINCHRQTEVQFADNEYYKTYETYHEEMAAGTRDKVTVEEIGGLECQKCHY
jgi:cytochrome c2